MRLIDGLNTAQRVVVVVAAGIALAAVGLFLAGIGSPRFGGHSYVLHVATGFRPPSARLAGWMRLIIWLVLDGIWAVASVVVLRPPQGSDGPH